MTILRFLIVAGLTLAVTACALPPMQERTNARAAIEAAEQQELNGYAAFNLSRARYHMQEAEKALARSDHFMACVHAAHAERYAKGASENRYVSSDADDACYRKPAWQLR